jgi:hypothetical protein
MSIHTVTTTTTTTYIFAICILYGIFFVSERRPIRIQRHDLGVELACWKSQRKPFLMNGKVVDEVVPEEALDNDYNVSVHNTTTPTVTVPVPVPVPVLVPSSVQKTQIWKSPVLETPIGLRGVPFSLSVLPGPSASGRGKERGFTSAQKALAPFGRQSSVGIEKGRGQAIAIKKGKAKLVHVPTFMYKGPENRWFSTPCCPIKA